MKRVVRKFEEFIKEDIDNASDIDSDLVDSDSVDLVDNHIGEVEEEGDVYIGVSMMNKLADELGVEYSGSGPLVYDGVEINFYSETEKYHIGNKKFSTPKEVVDFLSK